LPAVLFPLSYCPAAAACQGCQMDEDFAVQEYFLLELSFVFAGQKKVD
jgi:hypothetical protein